VSWVSVVVVVSSLILSHSSSEMSHHHQSDEETARLLTSDSADEQHAKHGGADALEVPFKPSHGLSTAEAEEIFQRVGPNCLPEKVVPKWYVFVSLLWQPMPIMIWMAALIEGVIGDYDDMGILLFIQFANASISFYESNKAEDAVAKLKESLKPMCDVFRDGRFIEMNANYLVPGDLVKLGSGGNVPADCRINDGQIDVDESQLNGESLPRMAGRGDEVLMGSIVDRGECEATVTATGAETFFGRTATLLQGDMEYSNLQLLLIDIMIVLVILSVTLCSIVFIYLVQMTDVDSALSFAVVVLVASIPLAIEIVTNTTLALGSHELSEHGAIVKRLSCIEDMAGMSILCSDKTGTLTMNVMQIQEYTPVYKAGETQYTLLRYGAMAARWKDPPKDALDRLVLGTVDKESLNNMEQLAFMPFDATVKRTEGTLRDRNTGETYKTTKGSPAVILKLVEEKTIKDTVKKEVDLLATRGIRCIAIAKTNPAGKWEILGLLTFLDPPRHDTKETINQALAFSVAVKMITGDHENTAKETARVLGMGSPSVHGETVFKCMTGDELPLLDKDTKKKPEDLKEKYGEKFLKTHVFSQVFPEHKYLIVECFREMGFKVGMTGDGVNDAPALKRADVGVAVSGSTDAAKAAADIVLTQEGLSTIVRGLLISRCIFMRIKSFITYRIAATMQLIFFFFIAVFAFDPYDYQPTDNPDSEDWPSYFHLPVLMLMLITLLNDGALITIAYDNVKPSPTPEKWNLRVLFFVGGAVMGGVACFSALLWLWIVLDSWSSTGVFGILGVQGLSYGQVTTAVYLNISVTDFLTLFSARTGELFFWETAPGPILLFAGCFSLMLSTIVACAWPSSYPDDVYTLGLARREPYSLPVFIWLYCLFWWVVQVSKLSCQLKFWAFDLLECMYFCYRISARLEYLS
jgi:H+-transporting ATPase